MDLWIDFKVYPLRQRWVAFDGFQFNRRQSVAVFVKSFVERLGSHSVAGHDHQSAAVADPLPQTVHSIPGNLVHVTQKDHSIIRQRNGF